MPLTEKTDSLVQGLLGRMCGYEFGESKPLIFVPPPFLQRNEKKVPACSELERAIMASELILPTKGTNIVKSRVATRPPNGTTECPPLRLLWPGDSDDDEYYDTERFEGGIGQREIILGRCVELLAANLPAIRAMPMSDAQKEEIIAAVAKAKVNTAGVCGLRNLTARSSYGPYFNKLVAGCATGTATGELSGECLPMIFNVVYGNFTDAAGRAVPHANHRHLYVVFFTKAGAEPSNFGSGHFLSRVPKSNGKSVFSPQAGRTDRPLVAGGVVGFDESMMKTPIGLETALRDYLNLQKNTGFVVGSHLTANGDRWSLDKGAFHYRSAKDNDAQKICSRLSTEFGVKLSLKFGRSAATHFNLKTISW